MLKLIKISLLIFIDVLLISRIFSYFTEEDTYGNYAKIMLNYFLAEGIVSSHELFVASQDTQPSQLISELPAVIENPSSSISSINDDKMQIAWRYQNMRVADLSDNEQTFGHYYDLTKKMDKNTIDRVKIIQWNGEKNIYFNDFKWNKYLNGFNNLLYIDLLKNIQESLKNENFYVNANPHKRNILRIGIHSLGSRLWLSDVQSDTDADFLKFFYCFRALLRSSYAVAVITVPVKNFDTHVRDEINNYFNIKYFFMIGIFFFHVFFFFNFRVQLLDEWNIWQTQQ